MELNMLLIDKSVVTTADKSEFKRINLLAKNLTGMLFECSFLVEINSTKDNSLHIDDILYVEGEPDTKYSTSEKIIIRPSLIIDLKTNQTLFKKRVIDSFTLSKLDDVDKRAKELLNNSNQKVELESAYVE